jgi:hypothetical protein
MLKAGSFKGSSLVLVGAAHTLTDIREKENENKKIKSNGRLQKQQYEPLLCHMTAMLMLQYALVLDYNVGIHLFHVISIVRLPVVRYVSRNRIRMTLL